MQLECVTGSSFLFSQTGKFLHTSVRGMTRENAQWNSSISTIFFCFWHGERDKRDWVTVEKLAWQQEQPTTTRVKDNSSLSLSLKQKTFHCIFFFFSYFEISIAVAAAAGRGQTAFYKLHLGGGQWWVSHTIQNGLQNRSVSFFPSFFIAFQLENFINNERKCANKFFGSGPRKFWCAAVLKQTTKVFQNL